MTGLTDLQTAVAAQATEVAAIVTYLQGLPALITSLQGSEDPDAAVEALAQQVAAATASLTSALAAAPVEAEANTATTNAVKAA